MFIFTPYISFKVFSLNRGEYNVYPSSSTSTWTAYNVDTDPYVTNSQTLDYDQLLTTRASEQTNKMNIYDFAGNEMEWTLEHVTSLTDYPCAFRGGFYNDDGSDVPASNRVSYSTSDSNSYLGFRSTLY